MSTQNSPKTYLAYVLGRGIQLSSGTIVYGSVDHRGKFQYYDFCDYLFSEWERVSGVRGLSVFLLQCLSDSQTGVCRPHVLGRNSSFIYHMWVSRKSEGRFLVAPHIIHWR